MRKPLVSLLLAAVGLAAGTAAHAGGVQWSVNVMLPVPAVVTVGSAPPPVYGPPPVVVAPAPVYVQPRPVYVAQPVYVRAPQPVYVAPPGHHHHHRHWRDDRRGGRDRDRDHDWHRDGWHADAGRYGRGGY